MSEKLHSSKKCHFSAILRANRLVRAASLRDDLSSSRALLGVQFGDQHDQRSRSGPFVGKFCFVCLFVFFFFFLNLCFQSDEITFFYFPKSFIFSK